MATKEQEQMIKRVSFILHRALIDIRLLALAQEHHQIHDLADTIEPFPGYIFDWKDEHIGKIRCNLEIYQSKYTDRAFNYLAFLEKFDPPEPI